MALDRRIEKDLTTVIDSVTKTSSWIYVYDDDNIALEVYTDPAGTTQKTYYTHVPGTDEHLALERGGSYYYYHADGLGSVTAITDANKNAVQTYSYDSFGMVKASTSFRNSFTYTGKEWDKETGLYYYRARYYDPMEGRFISKDPLGFAGGDVNLYGYVQNNPINWIDPFGLFSIPDYESWMDNNAQSKSQGRCAKYVRQGLEAGGANTAGHPVNAKDYGPTLLNNGFTTFSAPNYAPQAGDTVVFQPYPGGNQAGHIQTYDGSQWVSDFLQRRFFPSTNYQNSNYTIYRPPSN